MTKNILITGKPGCGKSTLVHKLRYRFKDKKIGGFITPEMRRGNQRYGFKIIDLSSGEEEIMASVDIQGQSRVSKYHIDVEAIDRIIDKFMQGYEKTDIFMVDEIGKMELYSERFKEMIKKILHSEKPVIATIALSKDPFIDKIKRRDDSRVFYLEKRNWKSTLNKIETACKQLL